MTKEKIRNSNLEILRIVSMILIIMHHYVVHGNFVWTSNVITNNEIILEILSLGGKLGVNCFFLITGYFMIHSKFSLKKIIKIILEVVFYSVSIFAIAYFTGFIKFNEKLLIHSIFPITFSMYWFATAYVLLYIFTPFLNILINNLNKKQHFILCAICIVLFSVIPTFITQSDVDSNLKWAIVMYFIAAYIRKYPNKYIDDIKLNILGVISMIIFLALSVVVFNFLGLLGYVTYFGRSNSLPLVILSISVFSLFRNMQVKNNKFINLIASSTFGVYLIHDSIIAKKFIWINLFKNNTYANSPYLLLHMMFSVIAVFVVCVIIDQIRIHIFERKIVDKIIEKLYNLFSKYKNENNIEKEKDKEKNEIKKEVVLK